MTRCTAVTAPGEHCKEPGEYLCAVIPTKYGYDVNGLPPPAKPRCLEHARRFMATTNRAVVTPALPAEEMK